MKETISLEPKDKTVSEETRSETNIDGQVSQEQVDGGTEVEMQGGQISKLEAEPGENDSNECSLLPEISIFNHVLNTYDRVGGIGGVLGEVCGRRSRVNLNNTGG